MPLYVPEGNQAVISEFQSTLRSEIPLLLPDLHINDPEFAALVSRCMQGLLQGQVAQDAATRVKWQ